MIIQILLLILLLLLTIIIIIHFIVGKINVFYNWQSVAVVV